MKDTNKWMTKLTKWIEWTSEKLQNEGSNTWIDKCVTIEINKSRNVWINKAGYKCFNEWLKDKWIHTRINRWTTLIEGLAND